jgi:stress response protein YsnF
VPRTIAALYDTRAEAEFARAALIADGQIRSPRIIARDTIGAVDGLDIASSDKDAYRDGLRGGGHLLVAQAVRGADPELIVDLVEEAIGHVDEPPEQWSDTGPVVRIEPPAERPQEALQPAQAKQTEPKAKPPRDRRAAERPPRPWFEEQLRHGLEEVPATGARVRAVTRDALAEEQVTLHDEILSVERRPAERTITEGEIEAGGLFKERVVEVAEMREEPVVTKIAVVHEEVIVRKTVKERSETVRDTVRQTRIEVEDMPAVDASPSAFFPERSG